MPTPATSEKIKSSSAIVLPKQKQSAFFPPLPTNTKATTGFAEVKKESTSANYFKGTIKGYLGENPNLYHTLNNFGDKPAKYALRLQNQGYCLLSLEMQIDWRKTIGLQRAWVTDFLQRNETKIRIFDLEPNQSVHLRLFGERDYTTPDQSWIEGSIQLLLLT
jgi:hypothetical protein